MLIQTFMLRISSVFFLKKMGEIYSTASFSHSTAIPFLRGLSSSFRTKGWFLGISNPEHTTWNRLTWNSGLIPWTVWSFYWSGLISFQAEICWDRYPVLKCPINWYRYSLYWGRNSRNILTSDEHILKTCTTSCGWHIWCICMTFVFGAGGSFCHPGNWEAESLSLAPVLVYTKQRLVSDS